MVTTGHREKVNRGGAARRGATGLAGLLAGLLLVVWPAVPAGGQVVLTHAAGYHAGGGPLGGGHPTAGAYCFTVPQGPDRLLLVLGPPKYDPALPREVSSQRACLTSLTYAGRPLTYDAEKMRNSFAAPHVWYLVDPPTGTHNLDMRQIRYDNGGENRMAVMAFTGVDAKNPFGQRVAATLDVKGKTARHEIGSRTGAVVVHCITYGRRNHRYFRIMPGPGQRLLWEDCHDYRYEWMGAAAPGADRVEMRWGLAGPTHCFVWALSVNPSRPGPSPKPAKLIEPLSADAIGAEKPGLIARVYDLSANPPKPGTRRQNFKTPALGAKIPPFDAKTPHTTKGVENIDLHPNNYRTTPYRSPDAKGVLGSGLRRNFVIEFAGRIDIPESGDVMFQLLSVDQSKLLIDGRLVIDNHGHNYNTLKTGVIGLGKGKHEIRLINVEDSHTFGVSLGWRLPSGHPHGIPRGHKAPISVIPASAFTHVP